LHFPVDFMCADKLAADATTKVRTEHDGIEKGWYGLDIGPQTMKNNSDVIARAKTIFWNGPQGLFEMDPFAKGSLTMLDDVIKATKGGATSVCGGGDTVSLLKKVKGAAN